LGTYKKNKRNMTRSEKKRKKKTPLQLLKAKLEKVQRLTILRRDKYQCVLRGVFQHHCDPILQADHLISRSNGSIFFDLRNLNCVCKSINATKGWHGHGCEEIQRELERITNHRYGPTTVTVLEYLAKKPFKPTLQWLEDTIDDYNNMYLGEE